MSLRTADAKTLPMIFLKTAPTPRGLNPGFLLSRMSQQARNPSSQADSSLVQSFLVTLASVLKAPHKNSLKTKIPCFQACFPIIFASITSNFTSCFLSKTSDNITLS